MSLTRGPVSSLCLIVSGLLCLCSLSLRAPVYCGPRCACVDRWLCVVANLKLTRKPKVEKMATTAKLKLAWEAHGDSEDGRTGTGVNEGTAERERKKRKSEKVEQTVPETQTHRAACRELWNSNKGKLGRSSGDKGTGRAKQKMWTGAWEKGG